MFVFGIVAAKSQSGIYVSSQRKLGVDVFFLDHRHQTNKAMRKRMKDSLSINQDSETIGVITTEGLTTCMTKIIFVSFNSWFILIYILLYHVPLRLLSSTPLVRILESAATTSLKHRILLHVCI